MLLMGVHRLITPGTNAFTVLEIPAYSRAVEEEFFSYG
jgi:hypothetical protein